MTVERLSCVAEVQLAVDDTRSAYGAEPSDTPRVVRGGTWNNNQNNARCAYRNNNHPDNRNDNIGFRWCVVSHDFH